MQSRLASGYVVRLRRQRRRSSSSPAKTWSIFGSNHKSICVNLCKSSCQLIFAGAYCGTMKSLLLFSLLLALFIPSQDDTSPLKITSNKWSHARQKIEVPPQGTVPPAQQMIPQNRNFARNARVNDPQGVRDPNADTLDGCSAAIEKSVAEARAPKTQPLDGYAYRIKVQNSSTKVVEIVFWEYQFHDPANPDLVARRQFLCGVNIPAGKAKELEGFSLSGPSDVIDVKTLNAGTAFKENVFINRVEYADGSIWQRKAWNLAEVKGSYERVLREQWVPGMCKGL